MQASLGTRQDTARGGSGGARDTLPEQRFADLTGRVVSCYWPIKAEFDLRLWMAARVATILPQPHDIAMGAIVTEEGRQWEAQP